jgi:hypothetical protein
MKASPFQAGGGAFRTQATLDRSIAYANQFDAINRLDELQDLAHSFICKIFRV